MINIDDFVFVDIETTGLNPDEHGILEVAYAIGLGEIKTLYPAHIPDILGNASPKALEVNGFLDRFKGDESGAWIDVPAEFADVDLVRDSGGQQYQAWLNLPKPSEDYEWDEFAHAIRGKTPVGANVEFDVEFIRDFFAPEPLGWSHRKVTLGTMAMAAANGLEIGDWGGKPISFGNLTKAIDRQIEAMNEHNKYMGFSPISPLLSPIDHTAAGDVKVTRETYEFLLWYMCDTNYRPSFFYPNN